MSHHHHVQNYNWKFFIGILLNSLFVIIELIYGVLSDSLSLIADAIHNMSDVFALLLSWLGHYLTKKIPTEKRTYGYRKSSILSTFANSLLLMVAIGGIIWESFQSLFETKTIDGITVIFVASIGAVINFATAALFFSDKEKDLNLKSAFLHMFADGAISIAVAIGGVIMVWKGVYWMDPVLSLSISLFILLSTWGLLRDSMNLIMDGVPKNIQFQEVKEYLTNLPNVVGVYDLHIWAMSTTEIALTAHLTQEHLEKDDSLLTKATQELCEKFHIHHVTLQLQRNQITSPCKLKKNLE